MNNTMPNGMDLNRLFATMNTSGVQLEQTDILKSLLLKKITDSKEKQVYDAIWQACENLNNYFERNLRQLFPNADWQNLTFDQLAKYDPEQFDLDAKSEEKAKGMTIAQLAGKSFKEPSSDTPADDKDDDENTVYCRSIISFSLLLMHAYRIFRSKKKRDDISVRLRDTRLGDCFETFVEGASEKSVKRFIKCLWKVRYQFDRWIVKWVEQTDDDREYLRLSGVSISSSGSGKSGKKYFTRSARDTSNLSQLQSVRNFTGERNAQYWLTPFLGTLIKENPTEESQVTQWLERIDNQLSLAQSTQKEASFALLANDTIATRSIDDKCSELREPQGTGFEHYWFQKVEYILWRKRKKFGFLNDKKLQSYRIASRNSVEHVHPQNEEYNRTLKRTMLDSFGNLVLLSPGENSSYSNQTVLKKRADFESKPTYDSLKLAHIFHSINDANDWGKTSIQSHQEAMLELIKEHYGKQV